MHVAPWFVGPAGSETLQAITTINSAAFSAPENALSKARPATASIKSGETAKSCVASPAVRAITREHAPQVAAAIQRLFGSGEASGDAHSAAVMALRFTAWPPKGAQSKVNTPVVAISGPGAGL